MGIEKLLQKIILCSLPFLPMACKGDISGPAGSYKPYCVLEIDEANNKLNVSAQDIGRNAGILYIDLYEDGILLERKNIGGIDSGVLVRDIDPSVDLGKTYYSECRDKDGNLVRSNEEIAYE